MKWDFTILDINAYKSTQTGVNVKWDFTILDINTCKSTQTGVNMCTGFVKKGNDLIYGFNVDLAIGAWDYKVYKKKDMFYIGIKVGSTIYKTHGINKNGNFANLPYMNDMTKGVFKNGKEYKRLDLLVNDYISNKLSYDELKEIINNKKIVNIPNASMHSLICDITGRVMILEPELGYKELINDYAVISNYPLLEKIDDYSPVWYGKDRYDKAENILKNSNSNFSALDGIKLLQEVRQEGEWATRVSFVYSKNENTVYYVLNNDFQNVRIHEFSDES